MRIVLALCLTLVGCASTGSGGDCPGTCDPPDGSTRRDGESSDSGQPIDLATGDMPKVYMATTIHAIDVGQVATGTLVALSGVVLTTPAHARPTSNGMCTYQAWVQDPNGDAPSGLGLFTIQPPDTTSGNPSCPAVPNSGGLFDSRTVGDNVNVKGRLFVQSFASGASKLIEHSIAVDILEKSSGTAAITPTPLNDPTLFAGYGSGFTAYEGMLIELHCGVGTDCGTAGSKLRVLMQPNPYLWKVTGNALFGSEFAEHWPGYPGPKDTAYTQITGVVNIFIQGSIEPRSVADFVP